MLSEGLGKPWFSADLEFFSSKKYEEILSDKQVIRKIQIKNVEK